METTSHSYALASYGASGLSRESAALALASGSPEIRAWARDLHRAGPGLLTGERPIFALALGWQVVLALDGYRVHNIDGANRFNVFHLAGECMERGLPVEDVLNTITVQRVFTPYQVLDVVSQVAEDAARASRSREADRSHGVDSSPCVDRSTRSADDSSARDTVYFFLSPCKQFFDGDVGEEEGEFLLKRLLGVFRYMARRSLPVMIVERTYDHPVFQRLYPELEALAACHWPLAQLTQSEHHTGELYYGTYAGSLFHAD